MERYFYLNVYLFISIIPLVAENPVFHDIPNKQVPATWNLTTELSDLPTDETQAYRGKCGCLKDPKCCKKDPQCCTKLQCRKIITKVCSIETTSDETLTKVCNIETNVDTLVDCAPTPITAPGTIATSGTYCLANDIIGTITIAVGDVVLDLNRYVVAASNLVAIILTHLTQVHSQH